MKQRKFRVSYKTAVNWCHNNLILLNNISEIDEHFLKSFFENNPEFLENLGLEIFQWFLTDCNEFDVRFLKESFPELVFAYSAKLDKYVLCVDHYGTGWDYVGTDCTNETIFNNTPDTDPIKAEYLKETKKC